MLPQTTLQELQSSDSRGSFRRVVSHMRRITLMVAFLALALARGCGAEQEPFSCTVHDDCWSDPALTELGRCGPEALCVNGICRSWCPQVCEIAREDVNPCKDVTLVCNDPVEPPGTPGFCVAYPISCETARQCPKYRPTLSGEWDCIGGTCRFPEFAYASEGTP